MVEREIMEVEKKELEDFLVFKKESTLYSLSQPLKEYLYNMV